MTVTIEMQAPAWASGQFCCKGPLQSGAIYELPQPGGTLAAVDMRDVPFLTQLGFTTVGSPSES